MTTMESNGRLRKSLADQIDRLDSILDGLASALNESVASAVKEAVGLAVREAVQAVLSQVLANPALLGMLHGGTSERSTRALSQRLRAGWSFVVTRTRAATSICKSLCGHTWRALRRPLTVVRHFKKHLLMALAVGCAAGTAAYFAGPWLAATASGVGGFATTLAVHTGVWLRKAMLAS
jgi:hypothetical protein